MLKVQQVFNLAEVRHSGRNKLIQYYWCIMGPHQIQPQPLESPQSRESPESKSPQSNTKLRFLQALGAEEIKPNVYRLSKPYFEILHSLESSLFAGKIRR